MLNDFVKPLATSGDFETCIYVLPVNNVEDCLHVKRSYIFILQVIGVFPHVDAEEWNETGRSLKRILIRTGRYPQRLTLLIVTEPTPTRPLNRHGYLRQTLLQFLYTAEVFADLLCKSS